MTTIPGPIISVEGGLDLDRGEYVFTTGDGRVFRDTFETAAKNAALEHAASIAADPWCPRCGFRESIHGQNRGPYVCR